jgi:hypothetical protein
MPTRRSYKYDYLLKQGLTHNEAVQFSRQYTMTQIRTLPYMRKLIRTRRLYRDNLKKRGFKPKTIYIMIADLYKKKKWMDGINYDPWKMLRDFRDQAIEDGDYFPLESTLSHHKKGSEAEKGSHHKGGLTKGDIKSQRTRAGQRASIRTRIAAIDKATRSRLQMTVPEYERLQREREMLQRQLQQ